MAQEFQIVILAGGTGSRMYPLTEGSPKSLLPVGNRPLISYLLELLERVGFNEAIFITNSSDANELEKFISEMYKGKLKVVFEVLKDSLGTAEALLKIKDRIHTNFIVVSCDLIVQEGFLHRMADIHRTREAAVTALFHKRSPSANNEEDSKKTTLNKSLDTSLSPDLIGLDDKGRILHFISLADVENIIRIKKCPFLKRFPSVTFHTNLQDAHFYIFSYWILELLEHHTEITSIKAELIPFLVKIQIDQRLPNKDGMAAELLNPKDLYREMSSSDKMERNRLGCFAYVVEDQFCARVNTIQAYMYINREIAKGTTGFLPWERMVRNAFIADSAQLSQKTQIGPECIVGNSTEIGEKCGVKKSIIGNHCKIGNNVKITNSVIMDHVTIMERSTIQNSIICNNVHIADSCTIINCQVGISCSIDSRNEFKDEKLIKDNEK